MTWSTWDEWAWAHCTGPRYLADLEELRALARRGCPDRLGSFLDLTLAEIQAAVDLAREVPRPERLHAWASNDEYGRERSDHALDAAQTYIRKVRMFCQRHAGAALGRFAGEVHEQLVRQGRHRLDPPDRVRLDHPAPIGAAASNLAAPRTGASWAIATTNLQRMESRYRPPDAADAQWTVDVTEARYTLSERFTFERPPRKARG